MSQPLAILGGAPLRTRPFTTWPVFGEPEEKRLLGALRSGKWGKLNGPEVAEFERRFAAMHGARHAIGVVNGTVSLRIALMAAGIQAEDEVIVPPYTFLATATAVVEANAVSVFADIDLETFNLDPKAVEAAITPRTRAIMPVHLFGQCADMDPILAIARQHNLTVIEDAAQAIGAEYRGRRAGTMGLLGCLSFFPSKNLGGFGDGGMVVTNDAALAEKIRCLRMHGMQPKYYHPLLGGNFRLDALQAAVLLVKLKHLDTWTRGRQSNAARYDQLLVGSAVTTPPAIWRTTRDKHHHIYNQYTLRCPNRDGLRQALQSAGIGCDIYYPLPLHLQECFAGLGGKPGDFPVAEAAAQQVLSIPIYPELSAEQIESVADTIRQA